MNDRLTWRHTDYLLKMWGRWVWLYGTSVGCYPRESAISGMWDRAPPFSWFRVRQLTAKGSGFRNHPGHRALCEFGTAMPNCIQRVHIAIGALPEGQFLAICAKYAAGLDADGHDYGDEQKAAAIEITMEAFHERLRRARIKLTRTLANSTGQHVNSAHSQRVVSAPNPA